MLSSAFPLFITRGRVKNHLPAALWCFLVAERRVTPRGEPLSSITSPGEERTAAPAPAAPVGSPPRPLAKHGTRTFIERGAFLNVAETKHPIDFL